MAESSETWSQRFEREFEAAISLLRRRPMLALCFAGAMIFYGWHQFLKSNNSTATQNSESNTKQPAEVSTATQNSGSNTKQPAEVTSDLASVGSAGWIFVGTRMQGEWRQSSADGIEPQRTLRTIGIPKPGSSYRVDTPVHLRVALPTRAANGSRPVMTNSLGSIARETLVKVDSVESLDITSGQQRTWIWAHVTILETPLNRD